MPWLYNGRGSNREIGATNDGWFPRTAGRLPQPVHYTTTQHYTHIPLQNTAQYYMHILYTVLFWANQLQFDRVENLLMSFYADFNNSLYLHTK